jgi:hypothetical protein
MFDTVWNEKIRSKWEGIVSSARNCLFCRTSLSGAGVSILLSQVEYKINLRTLNTNRVVLDLFPYNSRSLANPCCEFYIHFSKVGKTRVL